MLFSDCDRMSTDIWTVTGLETTDETKIAKKIRKRKRNPKNIDNTIVKEYLSADALELGKRSSNSKPKSSKKKKKMYNPDKLQPDNNDIQIVDTSSESEVQMEELIEQECSITTEDEGEPSTQQLADFLTNASISQKGGTSSSSKNTPESVNSSENSDDLIDFIEGVEYTKFNDPEKSILVKLYPPHCVYICGKAEVDVVEGVVEINGYQLRPKDSRIQVFSPKGHSSLLYLKGISEDTSPATDVEPAVIILRGFENEWTLGMRTTCPKGDELVGPEISTASNSRGVSSSWKLPRMRDFMDKLGFQLIPQSLMHKNKLLQIDPEWDNILTELRNVNLSEEGVPRICIFGGKGVGKSTFTRWLTNSLLGSELHEKGTLTETKGRVLYIDLDPGQTEFNPPGVVALHLCQDPILGPNFSHLRQPESAVFLGGVNVSDFPLTYWKAVKQLFEFASAQEEYANIPWIVNTMGFSTGLGVHLAVGIIKIFSPNRLIQLTINNEKRSFPFDLNPSNVSTFKTSFIEENLASRFLKSQCQSTSHSLQYKLMKLESVCGRTISGCDDACLNPWGMSPKNLRDAMLYSYFSNLIGATREHSFQSVIPCSIKLEQTVIATMDSKLDYDGIVRTLIGNLVALCRMPGFRQAQPIPTSNPNKMFVPNAGGHENEFLGYGIARAYDKESNILYIVTPLVGSEEILAKINAVICAGNVGLPVQLLCSGTNSEVPYVESPGSSMSKLDQTTKKYYAPGKKVTHSVLRNSLR